MKKQYNPKDLDIRSNYHLMISGIVPRPIAFVSSISNNNEVNLAPYSFFNGFGANPPIVGFSPALSGRTGKPKDTLLNIQETKEFTISIANSSMVGQVSLSSCEYERSIDEFEKTGLTKQESTIVKPPFVGESSFVMECKLYDIIYLGNKPASGNLILGEIVMFHISENILDTKGAVDPNLLDAISRMGGSWYSKSKDGLFEFKKPRHNGLGFDAIPTTILNSNIITANELSQLSSVDKKPKIVDKVYKQHKNDALKDLELLCKKFINEDLFDCAWTIVSILEER
ncbi:MAG: flavin reductase [Candidatus Marinimicrobia bacterium]|nr:flavin reductase [Candidatus Neomarinimicrobiota bacterium]|tara:strand:+ start:462 stop:1316 length:855 start_codon:yes stop_codon:yes gene_type:complete